MSEKLSGDADQQAYEVPLVEQLRSIPKDYRTCRAIQWSEDGRETGHQLIPVGYMMHRAADEIDRLRRAPPTTQNAGDGGCKELPKEPTAEMLEAGDLFFTNASFVSVSPAQLKAIYRAMLAAAPSPSVNEQADRGKTG